MASAIALAIVVALSAWLGGWDVAKETTVVSASGEPGRVSSAPRVPASERVEREKVETTRRAAAATELALEAAAPRSALPPPAGARRVPGRVVLPPGTPADERITVRARTSHSYRAWSHRHPAELDADGTFALWLEEGEELHGAELDARYLILDRPPGIDAAGVLVLEPVLGGLLHGRVVGLDESANDGLRVQLRVMRRRAFARTSIQPDTDGRFEFGGVEPGVTASVVVSALGFVRARAGPFTLEPGEALELELELAAPRSLVGRVVDGQGAGVEGAQISLRPLEIVSASVGAVETTDAAGAFAIDGVGPEKLELTAEHEGYVAARIELAALAAGERREDVLIALERAASLAGIVLLPDGRPAAGARVEVLAARSVGGHRKLEDARTDEDGHFRFDGLDRGEFALDAELELGDALAARAERFHARIEKLAAPASGLRLALRGGETFAARVLDDAGAPVPSVRVTLMPGRSVERGPLGSPWHCMLRPDDGRFELAGLAPGEWRLELHALGHARIGLPRVLVPTGQPLELRLARGARLAGRVRTPDGQPALRARVTARALAGELADGRSVVTRAQGRFTGLSLPPGTYRVFADSKEHAPSAELVITVAAGEKRDDLDLVLRPPARIEVAVKRTDGTPAARCSIRVERSDGKASNGLADLRGELALEALPAGTYHIAATDWAPTSWEEDGPGDPERPRLPARPTASAEVSVTEGGSARVELTLAEAQEERDG